MGSPTNLALKVAYLINSVPADKRKKVRQYVAAILSADRAGVTFPEAYENAVNKYGALVSTGKHERLIEYLNNWASLNTRLGDARVL